MTLTLRALVASVALMSTAVAGATPAVAPGWPVPAPSGLVLPGPGGGGVFVTAGAGPTDVYEVAAILPDGNRAWRLPPRDRGCGNCIDGTEAPRVQPDGRIGPIANAGGGAWAVDRLGTARASCQQGVVDADGTCVSMPISFPVEPATSSPLLLSAVRGGQVLWSYREPNHAWTELDAGGSAPPNPVVGDAGGTVYTAFGADMSSGVRPPSRVLAVDGRTGSPLWRATGPGTLRAIATAEGGVVVTSLGDAPPFGTALFDGAAGPRWSSPVVAAPRTPVLVDAPAHRLALQETRFPRPKPPAPENRVAVLDVRTGAVAWRSPPGDDTRLLSLSPGGEYLLAVRHAGRTSFEVRGRDFATRVRYPTAVPVEGALALADGTFLVSLAGDLAVRVDPAVSAPAPVRALVRLLHRTFAVGYSAPNGTPVACDRPRTACATDRRVGVIARLDLPRAARVTISLRGRGVLARVNAPRGTSYVRTLVGAFQVKPGRHVIDVRLDPGGHPTTVALPVGVRRLAPLTVP